MNRKKSQHEKVVFFFDENTYREQMHKYSIILEFAREISQAIKEKGFETNNILLCGLMQIKQQYEIIAPDVEIVGDTNKNFQEISYQKAYFSVNSNTSRDLALQVKKMCENVPQTLKFKYEKEIKEEIKKLLDNCFCIRQRYERNYKSIDLFFDVNFNAIIYTKKENFEDFTLDPQFTENLKERCEIGAKDERVEKVYNLLVKACNCLNQIIPLVRSPEMIIEMVQRDRLSNEFTPLSHFDYNNL